MTDDSLSKAAEAAAENNLKTTHESTDDAMKSEK
jgi:hypothetical protein